MTQIDINKLRALGARLRRYGGAAFPHEDKSVLEETCIEAADALLAMAEENQRLSTLARANNDLARQALAAPGDE